MRNLLLTCAATALLGACATAPATHLAEGRVLTQSATALDGVDFALTSLAQTGVLHGPAAAKAAAVNAQAHDAQVAAVSAYHAGKDADAVANSGTISALLAQLIAIIGGK